MFIQLNDDRLINLYWLDDVQKKNITENETTTYYLAYIMVNGTEYLEAYDDENTRNTAYTTVIDKLTN